MTSTRRTFFASLVGLGVSKTQEPGPMWKQLRPYTAAEEKRIEDRWKRIEANLDQMEANRKASWKRHQAWSERMDAHFKSIDANMKRIKISGP